MSRSQSADAAVFGVDLGKTRFDVMAADASGKPLRRAKLTRSTILPFFEQVPRALIGMEACPGAQWLARKLAAMGHTVRIIPAQFGGDARRWSRARELFDDIIAFTFGHELAHHYLGHTGCAKGQAMGNAPDPARLGRLLSVVPLFNQAGEAASDSAGAVNALDAGRARRPQYEWSETGGVLLLDYFARIESAGGGGGPLSLLNPVQFLRTHPNPLARIPIVQTVARTWRSQRPG